MRSRVLVRSRGPPEASTDVADLNTCTKRQRTKQQVTEATGHPTSRQLRQQDKIHSFELPQLEALLQGIGEDDEDDSIL